MFLDSSGETLFYIRRVDGHDSLFAHQPDHSRGDHHALLQSTPGRLMAWPSKNCVLVSDGWPRVMGRSLAFRFLPQAKLHALLSRNPGKVNELLTDVETLGEFSEEPRPLPPPIFELLQGETLHVVGFLPTAGGAMAPAVYVIDGRGATFWAAPLPFLEMTTIPSALETEATGRRHWLTVGESNHLFVLNERFELAGDVLWPAEEQGLARVAFLPQRNEAWVSAQSSLFVFDIDTLKLLGEVSAEPELRWHKGERVRGFLGATRFNSKGTRAYIARPLSGDVLELDTATRRRVGSFPMTVDPLELVCAHGKGRAYVQGLRSGAISWFNSHDI
ncbi:hypothetical protein PLCT1_01421 [Planctomycetaceae bacterium]|nr:hypothetical protein PLCT1_01421 [Planctomycetaceae bacterium]